MGSGWSNKVNGLRFAQRGNKVVRKRVINTDRAGALNRWHQVKKGTFGKERYRVTEKKCLLLKLIK